MDDIDTLIRAVSINSETYDKCANPQWIDDILDGTKTPPTWKRASILIHLYLFASYRKEDTLADLQRHIVHFNSE